MLIPQDNPTLLLVDFFDQRQGFLYEVCHTYEESVVAAMLEREILLSYSMEGRALLVRDPFDAFALSLRLSGIREGDTALFPTNGSYQYATLLVELGVNLVFIDLDASGLSVSEEQIKQALTETKDWKRRKKTFLFVVHTLGISQYLGALKTLIDSEELQVIECATDIPLSSGALLSTSLGGYRIFSLSEFPHGIGCAGAMLCCPTEERCRKGKDLLRSLRVQDLPDPAVPILKGDLRISSMQLIRAYIESKKKEEKAKLRKVLFDSYQRGLHNVLGLDLFVPSREEDCEVTPLRILLSVDDSLLHFTKSELVVRLQEKGIEALPLSKPLHLLPAFEKYPRYLNGLAEGWYSRSMLLPCGSGLSLEKAQQVVAEIIAVVQHFN